MEEFYEAIQSLENNMKEIESEEVQIEKITC
jgi:hypothetical protein